MLRADVVIPLAMGNTIRHVTEVLKDPYTVRRVQERFGVKQVPCTEETDEKDDVVSKASGRSSSTYANGVSLTWLARKKKKRLCRPGSSTDLNNLTSSPEREKVVEIVVETLPVLDVFFRLATELGHEPFYITFFPFLTWNVDTAMARHVVVIWCASMYLGQASKALFRWNRPSSPPALRLENNPNLETEYGFPSTHAIVSTTVPFYIAYYLFGHYMVN